MNWGERQIFMSSSTLQIFRGWQMREEGSVSPSFNGPIWSFGRAMGEIKSSFEWQKQISSPFEITALRLDFGLLLPRRLWPVLAHLLTVHPQTHPWRRIWGTRRSPDLTRYELPKSPESESGASRRIVLSHCLMPDRFSHRCYHHSHRVADGAGHGGLTLCPCTVL